MSNDPVIKGLTTGAVMLVAAIAAIISFTHIQHLAITHGQTYLASALLPLSIDGAVAVSSLVMLRAAKNNLGVAWRARGVLVLSVIATLAANVAYGEGFGVTGALLSGWPAIAFVGCTETVIWMVRRERAHRVPEAEHADVLPETHPWPREAPVLEEQKAPVPAIEEKKVPSLRQVMKKHRVGAPRARQILATEYGVPQEVSA